MTTASPWYEIASIATLDTPLLAVYPERVAHNIATLKKLVPDLARLRPHVKTHKSPEATRLLLQAGIYKFKCATIAEADMLAALNASDVLLAYQPVGPKIERLVALVKQYPNTTFSCLVDNPETAHALQLAMQAIGHTLPVWIDLNVGMDRTGVCPEDARTVIDVVIKLPNLSLAGLHAYDGHLRDQDLKERTRRCDEAFATVLLLHAHLAMPNLSIVAGGSPTFPIHARRHAVECSPGTFIYWDQGYAQQLPDLGFLPAMLVVTRIISVPSPGVVCVDLGHKALASENPLHQRVVWLNGPGLEATGHSEEHMVWKNEGPLTYQVGDVLYGLPYHVCPTCALHDTAVAIEKGQITGLWHMTARYR